MEEVNEGLDAVALGKELVWERVLEASEVRELV